MRTWLVALLAAVVLVGGGSARAAEGQGSSVLPLSYRPEDNRQEVREIKQEEVKKVYQQKKIDGAQVLLFSRPYEQDDYLYGAWVKDGKLYDLGAVGTLPFAEQTYIDKHEFNGHAVLRIDGVYAAKAVQSNFYLLGAEQVKPFLRVNGHAVESDLDRDGKKEIVTMHSLSGTTKIFKEMPSGQFEVADINQATAGKEVVFQMEDDLFIAKFADGTTKKYLYTPDGLREEK